MRTRPVSETRRYSDIFTETEPTPTEHFQYRATKKVLLFFKFN